MTLTDYVITDVQEFVRMVKNGQIGFPFLRTWASKEEINRLFQLLLTYKVKNHIEVRPYKIHNLKLSKDKLLFLGRPVLIKNVYKYENIWKITTFFQEYCIINCKVRTSEDSPSEYFYKHPEKVGKVALKKWSDITPEHLSNALFSMVKWCGSFRPYILMGIMQIFGSKRILDFSAGWGDRLIGAIAGGAEKYCGIDPNLCVNRGYQRILRFFKKIIKTVRNNTKLY